jgi:hypothetical protein
MNIPKRVPVVKINTAALMEKNRDFEITLKSFFCILFPV